MNPQTSHSYHVYDYVLPVEDWEVKPPISKHGTQAEMAWYPHSNRLYFRWQEKLSNPVKVIDDGANGRSRKTHWGQTFLKSETTFYVRDIAEERLPKPYTYVTVYLTWGKAGGPSKADMFADPPYDVIKVRRSVWSWSPNEEGCRL